MGNLHTQSPRMLEQGANGDYKATRHSSGHRLIAGINSTFEQGRGVEVLAKQMTSRDMPLSALSGHSQSHNAPTFSPEYSSPCSDGLLEFQTIVVRRPTSGSENDCKLVAMVAPVRRCGDWFPSTPRSYPTPGKPRLRHSSMSI